VRPVPTVLRRAPCGGRAIIGSADPMVVRSTGRSAALARPVRSSGPMALLPLTHTEASHLSHAGPPPTRVPLCFRPPCPDHRGSGKGDRRRERLLLEAMLGGTRADPG
jgi:hypothetical protein